MIDQSTYQELFESALDGMLIIENECFIQCNDAAVRMLGYGAPADLLQMHPSKISPLTQPDGRRSDEKADEMIQLAVEKGHNRFEWIHLKADGTPIWIEVSLTHISSQDNRVIHVVWHNIDAKKLAEDKLIQSNKQIEEIINKFPVAIIRAETDNTSVGFFNQSFHKLVGWDLCDIDTMEKWFTKAYPDPDYREQIISGWADLIEVTHDLNLVTSPYPLECRVACKNGTIRFCEVWYHWGGGNVFGIFHDVTRQKDVELQLVEKKNEAEQANVAKTKFLAAASHDLRQPVQAISLFIHALKNDEHDARKLNILGKVEESAHSLSSLLNTLLNVSRLDAGVVRVKNEPFKISSMFSHLLEEYEDTARSNNIQFSCVPCSVVINSDQTLIISILRNLITNAFMHSETQRVLMGCRRLSDGYALLQVWDSGKGISEKHIKEIFNEFYQIDNEARNKEKGLGLGLAIVKRVSKLLNHDLNVNSKPGCGTVFSLKVPLAQDQSAQLDHTKGNDNISRIKGLSIVIIEDEDQVREALRLVLENAGHAVLGLNDVSSAVNTAQLMALSTPPDIIIADYRLANGVTGVDAIAFIRKTFKEDVPAFLLTGDTAPKRIHEAMKSGFSLLHKPVRSENILDKINDVLCINNEA